MSPENNQQPRETRVPTGSTVPAVPFYRRCWQRAVRMPHRARIIVGLFLFSAVFMAIYMALTATDANLHLRLQHDFRSAQVSVWVDDNLAYSGRLTGSTKKKFGLIPTDSAQGTLTQVIPVHSGVRNIRLRVEPDNAAAQEDIVHAYFARRTERDLVVSARRSGIAVSWQAANKVPVETSSASADWLSRYAGSLFLTIAGSIMSAIAGYAIKELPARLRSTADSAPTAELGQD
jgi:hypothetical protein